MIKLWLDGGKRDEQWFDNFFYLNTFIHVLKRYVYQVLCKSAKNSKFV